MSINNPSGRVDQEPKFRKETDAELKKEIEYLNKEINDVDLVDIYSKDFLERNEKAIQDFIKKGVSPDEAKRIMEFEAKALISQVEGWKAQLESAKMRLANPLLRKDKYESSKTTILPQKKLPQKKSSPQKPYVPYKPKTIPAKAKEKSYTIV